MTTRIRTDYNEGEEDRRTGNINSLKTQGERGHILEVFWFFGLITGSKSEDIFSGPH
jgi:hypothetical protein